MSAKFMHVFADESPDLQKQIGCMSGIFQIFNRQHHLTRKRLTAHSHKRHPSGHSISNSSSNGTERNACGQQIILEKNHSKRSYENQRVSMESSRTSFSSSSCSSFSSLECHKPTHQEHPTFDRMKASPNLKPSINGTRCISREHYSGSTGAQEDTIYGGARALSVKTSTKEDVNNQLIKHRDSPRPKQVLKSMDGSYVRGVSEKSRMHMDLDKSLEVLSKNKEVTWNFSEVGELRRSSYEVKDASCNTLSREARRFSYDGREGSLASLDSREHSRPISKVTELPRLSLDSRQGSLRSCNFVSAPNSSLKELDTRSINQVSAASGYQQEFANHKSSPSVVAKLMGLEAMPNLNNSSHEPLDSAKMNANFDLYNAKRNNNFISKSSTACQDSKHDRVSRSPKYSYKEPVTPKLNNPGSITKPVSSTRLPLETAPWRQPDRVPALREVAFQHSESHLRKPPESVYIEIEKRLKELEFRQSSKDLRALKQMANSMEAKGLLETEKGEKQLGLSSDKKHGKQSSSGDDHNLRLTNARNRTVTLPLPTMVKKSSSPRVFASPIVIMKPTKLINRSDITASSIIPIEGTPGSRKLRTDDPMDKRKAFIKNILGKERTPRASSSDTKTQTVLKNFNNKHVESCSQRTQPPVVQISSRPQQPPTESNGSYINNSSSISPRLQQRKLENERKLRPSPPSESNKPQRPSGNKQTSESVSPRSRVRQRPAKAQKNDNHLGETTETQNISQQSDETSVRTDINISMGSQADVEISTDQFADKNLAIVQQGRRSPPRSASDNSSSVLKQKGCSLNLNEEGSMMKRAAAVPEQPSPVSVLDASFYQDDLPPLPVKKISNAFKGTKSCVSDESWSLMGAPDALPANLGFQINHKKFEKIQNLVMKLSELSPTDGAQTTDHIASLCETKNPDHRYVSEILLASGLLFKDLSDGPLGAMPIQLHPSGQPINPDLFLVLQQTMSAWLPKPEAIHESNVQPKSDPEKLHRKVLFDLVNEILIQKYDLTMESPSSKLLLGARKLTGKYPSGQRLLRELCSEIEKLHAERLSSSGGDDDDTKAGEDVLRRSEGWFDLGREVSGVVLEIERSIFKDLIDEVVSGEAAFGLRSKSGRRRATFCY